MNNLLKILIGIILVAFALVFFAFAIQNSADILVTVLPSYTVEIPLYLLVLLCLFVGFISALVITRFEYFKAKFNIVRLIKKLKRGKNQSKYISE